MARATGRRNGGYHGIDRRGVVEGAPQPATDRTWIVGGVLLGILLVGLGWLSVDGDPAPLALAVRSSALLLASVLTAASLLYWRATGEAAGYLVATAGWLTGIGVLTELVYTSHAAGWFVLCAAPFLLAAVWVGRAIVAPNVDASSGPVHQVVVATVSLVVIWGTATGLAVVLEIPLRTLVVLLHVGTAAAWGVVAVLGLLRAVRGTSVLRSWIGWMAVCLSFSMVAYLMGRIQIDSWMPIGGALRLSGLLIGVIGAAVALSRSAIGRRDALYRESLAHRDERRLLLESEREHDHEIRTALLAIEGATLTLDRHRDRLDEVQRDQLSDAVRSGMQHLRSLTIATPGTRHRKILPIVKDRVALACSRGLSVELRCAGTPSEESWDARILTQVLDNLLTNAERHGGADVNVDIEVASSVEQVTMTVIDDGPGIPEHDLERIFELGYRRHSEVDGEGIGLAVARRLLRAGGGDVVACPTDAGARFDVRLPRLDSIGEAANEVQDVSKVRKFVVARMGAGGVLDDAPAAGGRPVVQHHGQLRSRLRRIRRNQRQVVDDVVAGGIQDDGDVGDLFEERAKTVTE